MGESILGVAVGTGGGRLDLKINKNIINKIYLLNFKVYI